MNAAQLNIYRAAVCGCLPNDEINLVHRWQNREIADQELVNTLRASAYPNSHRRYQLIGNVRDFAIKLIFERAFQREPERITALASTFEGSSYYPMWKQVVYIDFPRNVGAFLQNSFVRFTVVATGICISGVLLCLSYLRIERLVALRLLPFLNENTPMRIIQILRVATRCIRTIQANLLITLFCLWAVQTVVVRVLPEIPYVTNGFRKMNLLFIGTVLFGFSDSLGRFLVRTSINLIVPIYWGVKSVSLFFLDIAKEHDVERQSVCKRQAYAQWLLCAQTLQVPPPA